MSSRLFILQEEQKLIPRFYLFLVYDLYLFSPSNKTLKAEREVVIKQHLVHNPPGAHKVIFVEDLTRWLTSGKPGDILITSDILCLGSTSAAILSNLSQLLQQRNRVVIIKQQYEFKDDRHRKVFAEAFQIAAQVSLDVSQYSQQEENKSKAGRPVGSKSVNKTLAAHHEEIENALRYGVKITILARRYNVSRNTVRKYINENVSEELRPNNKSPKKKE